MRRLYKLLLLIAAAATLLLTTGCMTESLHEANISYADPTREVSRTDQRLIGSYVGSDYCNGTLSEIYQFESPFIQRGEPKLFEVQIPVYGVTDEQLVRAFETDKARPFEERAELWFWAHHPAPNAEDIKKQSTCRRIDIFWQPKSGKASLRRFIPESGTLIASQKNTDLRIPWRQRNRFIYAARNLGYTVTVPADATLYAAGYAGLAVGYSFLVCPTGTIWLLSELL